MNNLIDCSHKFVASHLLRTGLKAVAARSAELSPEGWFPAPGTK